MTFLSGGGGPSSCPPSGCVASVTQGRLSGPAMRCVCRYHGINFAGSKCVSAAQLRTAGGVRPDQLTAAAG